MSSLKTLDFVFASLPVVLSLLWITQALCSLILTGAWTGGTSLFLFSTVHTVTVFAVCPLYLYLFFFTNRDKTIPIRVVTAILILSIGIFLNGLVWSISNIYLGSGTGTFMPQIHTASSLLIIASLYVLNKFYKVIQIQRKFMIVAISLYLISIFLFIDSKFFQNWALYENGLGPDPHNWQWVFEKTVAVLMWAGVVKRTKKTKIKGLDIMLNEKKLEPSK